MSVRTQTTGQTHVSVLHHGKVSTLDTRCAAPELAQPEAKADIVHQLDSAGSITAHNLAARRSDMHLIGPPMAGAQRGGGFLF